MARPTPVLVDATASTPVYLRALEHGADYVLHSATKYLERPPRRAARRSRLASAGRCGRLQARRAGAPASPRTRGCLAALTAACTRSSVADAPATRESATEIAARLERARTRSSASATPGFGGLLSFDVAGGADAARRVETSMRVIENATSLGGVRSTLEIAPPVGRRPRPAEPRPAQRRPRAGRGALGRPESGAEQVDSAPTGVNDRRTCSFAAE